MNIKHHNNQFCNNCGKIGHSYNQCSKPIISLGIIAFNKQYNNLKYLLICRKDSLGYVEFIRGKYPLYNQTYIQNLINEMTISEKNKLLTKDFADLWKQDISEKTKLIIWKYLQLILFSAVNNESDGKSFGDTAKLFEAINEDELKNKLEETMEQMGQMEEQGLQGLRVDKVFRDLLDYKDLQA